MKVLVNYKNENGKRTILKAQALYSSEDIDFEIIEVSDLCNIKKLAYDDNNKIVEDKEKLEMQKKIEEMAEIIVEKEFEETIKGEI